ncbi:hypothetical protein ACIQWR_37730 [Streptomyces sp. NPDC098789]|uniref:hypothetical protein n=1 Tax=Streptomyces sp. NPDC098789 TaxID=3366098 RepID=UPI0037F83121
MRSTGIPALGTALLLGCGTLLAAATVADAGPRAAQDRVANTARAALVAGPSRPFDSGPVLVSDASPTTATGPKAATADGSGNGEAESVHAPPGTLDLALAAALAGGVTCVTYAIRRRDGARVPAAEGPERK